MEPIIKNEIRLDLVYKLIKENFRNFLLIGFVTSVVTMALLFCIPRHYVVTVKLAPEYGESSGGGAFSSAASMIIGSALFVVIVIALYVLINWYSLG